MSAKELIPGLAASQQECDDFIAALVPNPAERKGPVKTITELSDDCLRRWATHCTASLVNADMRYLCSGKERAYWFMRTQDAERELARRGA